MRNRMVKPNSDTLLVLLSACAASGALVVGRHVHEYAKEEGLDLDAALGTALVDMYLKSGCLQEAMDVFSQMQLRDVKAWTAMIMGLGAHGMAEDALQLFHEMEDEGMNPNEVTFLVALSACNHGGLVASMGVPVLLEANEDGPKVKGFIIAMLLHLCPDSTQNRSLLVREGAIPPLVLSQSGSIGVPPPPLWRLPLMIVPVFCAAGAEERGC